MFYCTLSLYRLSSDISCTQCELTIILLSYYVFLYFVFTIFFRMVYTAESRWIIVYFWPWGDQNHFRYTRISFFIYYLGIFFSFYQVVKRMILVYWHNTVDFIKAWIEANFNNLSFNATTKVIYLKYYRHLKKGAHQSHWGRNQWASFCQISLYVK